MCFVVYISEQNTNLAKTDFFQRKDEALSGLLEREEIKKAFDEAFYQNSYDVVLSKLQQSVNWEEQDWNTLGQIVRELNIDINQVLSEFRDTFIKMVKLSQTPSDRLMHTDIEELLVNQKLDSNTLDKIVEKLTYLEQFFPKPSDLKSIDSSSYPGEFEALIQEKIHSFCGREFVFDAFNEFLSKYPKGYFTVVGDAGMGKSAIAAKYVDEHKDICYFNSFADGRTRPEQFLESVRKQLINRYNLKNTENADLGNLLTQASQKLADGQRLVILVDALDEVEQKTGGNLLNLPNVLPDKTYFLLTRRPYISSQKRLFLSPGIPAKELDLTAEEYMHLSREDVKKYLRFSLENDTSLYKDGLNKWIINRKDKITTDAFIEQVADKSENNFFHRHNRGYFTIVGEPGSGKTAALAQYVQTNSDVIYYDAQLEGKNHVEAFLTTVCTQLSDRVHNSPNTPPQPSAQNSPQVTNRVSNVLPESATQGGSFLSLLLQKISDQLEPHQRFIIAIDGCDSIDRKSQPPGSNLFYLPRYLPNGIYFLLTRRPFLKGKSGLLIEAPSQNLNLTEYAQQNTEDVRAYIWQYLTPELSLETHEEAPDLEKRLNQKSWLRTHNVTEEEFCDRLTAESENNFMYISTIINAIAEGVYSEPWQRDPLPSALEVYYQQHWQKMTAEGLSDIALQVLRVLSSIEEGKGISASAIAEIVNQDEYDVEELLENWFEFLHYETIEEEPYYRFYHSSFQRWIRDHLYGRVR
ncbi:AAA family ATPase [Aetokthonos hydrillicola Thurmond2011]|jgi:predicted DNA-binding ribbon-helix-helix protein|uniref:AAA family ATPase n=1 Tax=Aetokthonos hydrillicola Thurmond2011 TaxID=2712845 RepID=A0AAP5IE19_9CYAN|nr:AAA family ATPase [Aetokthonos hydrillicola]MBO3459191.1 AAA family ATPase [Aetokthonos hydrillicola CCALA 1050]MBW4584150.1 AAA family ATPase [Aetokthonos hydrillicola CCALA 1050]MDR9898317.1 AAA family ATPase [Aetokthonos hydrillicola Thurmond2011]